MTILTAGELKVNDSEQNLKVMRGIINDQGFNGDLQGLNLLIAKISCSFCGGKCCKSLVMELGRAFRQ